MHKEFKCTIAYFINAVVHFFIGNRDLLTGYVKASYKEEQAYCMREIKVLKTEFKKRMDDYGKFNE